MPASQAYSLSAKRKPEPPYPRAAIHLMGLSVFTRLNRPSAIRNPATCLVPSADVHSILAILLPRHTSAPIRLSIIHSSKLKAIIAILRPPTWFLATALAKAASFQLARYHERIRVAPVHLMFRCRFPVASASNVELVRVQIRTSTKSLSHSGRLSSVL